MFLKYLFFSRLTTGFGRMIEMLVRSGTRLDFEDIDGNTPFDLAKNKHSAIAQAILKP